MIDNFSPYGNSPFEEEPQGNGVNNSPSRENGEGNPRYDFPYGNGYPYGGYPNGYPYRRKPSMIKRIKTFFTDERVLSLSIASIGAAAAIILFDVLRRVFSSLIYSSKDLQTLYSENSAVFGMLYTVLCVAVPFLLAYIFIRVQKGLDLPLGAPRKNSGVMLLIPAGLGICYIGNIAVSYMMTFFSSLGISSYSYDAALTQTEPLPENMLQAVITVMYMAVFPAIFEEFAFRGVIMQPLRKYGDWFAIIVSAVMFGLVHGNIMQMPFAIIAGVALGYSAIVTGSMWTGIVIHFLNNFLSVIFSWARTALPDRTNIIFSAVFTYGIIVIGIVALTGYAWQNPRMMRLYPSCENVKTSRAAAVYFLMPSMLVAIVLMLLNIWSDMVVG